MSYPGNPALAAEVQRRILATYGQSVELGAAGRVQEASLGCEFILQLDAQFFPAQVLRERLAGATGPLSLDDLRDPAAVRLGGTSAASAAPPAQASPALVAELTGLLARRDFSTFAERLRADTAALEDPRVVALAESAQAKMEAEPYVQRFVEASRAAIAAGQLDQVAALVAKGRSLDPDHPALDEVERAAQHAAAPVAPVSGGAFDFEREPLPLEAVDVGAPAGDFEMEISEDEWNLEDVAPPPVFDPSATQRISSQAHLSSREPALDLGAGGALPSLGELPDLGTGLAGMPALDFAALTPPAPAAPAPVLGPAAASLEPSFDFSAAPLLGAAAPSSAGSGGDDRIRALLDEGQAAFDRGDFQGSIDSWSRIFLIDVDHAEAAQRIERARRMKAEQERQVEEIYHEGLNLLESGDSAGARERFARVRELAPGHLAAREYLDRLDAGETPVVRAAPPPPALPTPLDFGPELGGTPEELKEEILLPPGADSMSAADILGDVRPRSGAGANLEGFRMVAVKKETSKRTFVLVGGAVLVLVLAGAFLLARNWNKIFPNSASPDANPTVSQGSDPVDKARKLQSEGKTEIALIQLKRLRPNHPRYAEAQALIAELEASIPRDETDPNAPTPEQAGRREQLLAVAARALSERELLVAHIAYDAAAKIKALEGVDLAQSEQVALALAPLREEITLFRDREYEFALPRLWRKHEAEPGNRDVRRMLVDSYHNLAVRSLQQGDLKTAQSNLAEALTLAPADVDLQRLQRFTQAYKGRSQDFQFRLFAKHFPLR